MKKSRLAFNSAAIFGASLCGLAGAWGQATVSSGSNGSVIYTADANPNRPNGSGGQYGNYNDLISSVVVTTGYENVQSTSTTIPANSVQEPTIFFEININPGTAQYPTDITSGTNTASGGGTGQWWADYDLALETVPGAGLVASTPSSVSNAYGKAVGISTGENYFINGFNNKGTSPSTTGANQVYNYSGGWNQVAGSGQSSYTATTTSITPTSITYGIPLSVLGLSVGQSFTFDAYTTYGGLPYDALDNSAFAPAGYVPYSGSTYYDSATEPGSALSTYTVAAPTLSWNDTSAAAGYADGRTWDNNSSIVYSGNVASPGVPTNYNWNNGLYADYYVDGSNVIFNDVNNATSNGGTNANAYSVTLNTTVAPASVVVNNSLGNYTISGTGTIAGTNSLTKSGTGTLTLATANIYSGGTSVSAGLLLIEPTSSNTSALPKGALSITGGELELASNVTQGSQSANVPTTAPQSNVNITSLAISGTGKLDIANNHLIVDYTAGDDPIGSIATWIADGAYGSGTTVTWTGTGITSSAAAANPSYGIGYADAADQGNPAGLASGQIEIMYTLLGDANLDGKVNGTDFNLMATNFNQAVTNGWDKGDFNYDGKVNGNDFVLLAANFNQFASQSAVSSADTEALDAFAAANGIGLTSVPEPASIGLLLAGATSLMSRRRRKL